MPDTWSAKLGETHIDATNKQLENAALKQALDISSEYVGGSSFDRELQSRRKDERMAQRKAEEAEVAAMEAVLEREKEREARKKRKEDRNQEKEGRRKLKAEKHRRDAQG